MALLLLLLHLIMILSLCTSAGLGEPLCPYTWSRPVDNSDHKCTCGDDIGGIIQCDIVRREVKMLFSYCMTYDNMSNETVLGSCPLYSTVNNTNGYIELPEYVEDLNHALCHRVNREGRLCGECQSGFAPGPLSYDHECVKCNINPARRWVGFLAYQFIPVTIFFFVVLVFRVEVISGPLTAFTFFAQVYSSPGNYRLIELLGRQATGFDTSSFFTFENILFAFYGIWNLDFARPYLADFCLDQSITKIESVAMGYIIPFYLILLTVVVFTVVELHGRGFKPIVVAWRPLVAFCFKFRRDWRITDSLIHTIATFLLLSYTKLVVVSIRILDGTFLYDVDGNRVGFVPYFSTENEYFHGEHALFATLAILTLITLVPIPPMILLLYPFRACHVCMGVFCRPRLQYGLKTFVESFQGCYKDGSSNRYDFRYTAGWYFVLRIIVAVGELDNVFSSYFGQEITALTLLLTAVGFALLQPYKKYVLNVVDMFHFVTLSLIYWLILSDVYLTLLNRSNKALGVIAFLSVLPCVYIVSLTMYWMCFIKKLPQRWWCYKRRRMELQPSESSVNEKEQEVNSQTPLCQSTNDNTFADRLANPTAYDALIPARRNILARRHSVVPLVHQETQTLGHFPFGQVTVTPKEEGVALPWQPPTSSVLELGNSWERIERDVVKCDVQVI